MAPKGEPVAEAPVAQLRTLGVCNLVSGVVSRW
jgi:uncharacterized protein YjeT (DUF2065 family)